MHFQSEENFGLNGFKKSVGSENYLIAFYELDSIYIRPKKFIRLYNRTSLPSMTEDNEKHERLLNDSFENVKKLIILSEHKILRSLNCISGCKVSKQQRAFINFGLIKINIKDLSIRIISLHTRG